MKGEEFFYLWINHLDRTCYGKTSDPNARKMKYEGHYGDVVEWTFLAKGSDVPQLEDALKSLVFKAGKGFHNYEWIMEDVSYESIEKNIQDLINDNAFEVEIIQSKYL